jgi:hypothetical protein
MFIFKSAGSRTQLIIFTNNFLRMDKKNTLLIWFFILLIVLAIFGNYYRVAVLKDYEVIPLEATEGEPESESTL